MPSVTIRLCDEDAEMLSLLAEAELCSKTEVICRALRGRFDAVFADRKVLFLPEDKFAQVLATLDSEMTPQERKGREKIAECSNKNFLSRRTIAL